jgi:photosystem II stability/assembly factor-like uncharacterized protein
MLNFGITMKKSIQTILIFILLLSSNHVHGQWEASGGPVTNISISGLVSVDSFLFASAPCGIYISNNDGKSWNAFHYYTFSSYVFFKDTLIIADDGYRENKGIAKLYRYENTWKHKWANYNPQVHDLFTDNEKIYAATESEGIIYSKNTTNWEKINSGLPLDTMSSTNPPFYYVVTRAYAVTGNKQYLYAGTKKGLYRTEKQEIKWENINNGIEKSVVSSIYCNDSVLIIANIKGIYKSVDNGNNWNLTSNMSVNNRINNIEFIENKLFALSQTEGILVSVDFGSTWEKLNNGLQNLNITSIIKTENNWFSGTGDGVYKDYGNWKNSSSGMVCSSVIDLLSTDSSLVSLDFNDVFVSKNADMLWNNMTQTISKDYFHSVIYANNQLFFAADITGNYQSDCRVYTSVDLGNSWSVVSTLAGFDDSYRLRTNGSDIISFEDDVMLLSNDGAKTWKNISPPKGMGCNGINDVVFCGDNIFVALCGPRELLKSADMGTNWTFANSGLPAFEIYNIETCDNLLFAATQSGLYKSTDKGTTWKFCGTGIPNSGLPITSVEDIVCNENFFFLCTPNKVFASATNGESWSDISAGLPPLPEGIWGGSLLLKNDILYFGTNNFGIWKRYIKDLHIPDIEPDKQTGIMLFPNPANDNVTIRLEEEFQANYVEIYHLSGKIVSTRLPFNNQINIADLPAGIYILKVIANEKYYLSKIIKTNRN